MENAYERGKALTEKHNPGLEETLETRYGALLPGMPQYLISFVYGQHYSRPGLALRDRSLATIAALTHWVDKPRPSSVFTLKGGLKAGLTKVEIAEAIWQMSLYGGFPAATNALNIALDVFREEGGTEV